MKDPFQHSAHLLWWCVAAGAVSTLGIIALVSRAGHGV